SHDDSAKQRFVREAQAASATNHRNICIIHNVDETDDGRLFIVMAYYEGETLKQRLERGPLPIPEAIEIATEIAEGLAKAHAHGVVHRDVKPGNLIVTDDGVKILDFGLAKFADSLQLTVPGSTIGTVAYMSPEQARGEEADARSDVWALGIVLFEMLTGSPPFRGAYPEAMCHAIKHEPVPALRKLRPDVPEVLERIVMKALDKDVTARYQGAREPARDLRLLLGRTVPLELRTEELPEIAARRPEDLPRRRRRTLTPARLALTAAALLLAAGGWYWWSARPVERVRVAIAPVANHTGVASLDRYRLALTESLVDELRDSPNVRVVPYLRLIEMVRPFMGAAADVSSTEAVQAVATASGAPFVIVPTLAYRDRDSTWLMQIQVRNAETGTSVSSYETAAVSSTLSEQAAFRLVAAAAESVQAHFKAHGPGRSYTPRPVSSRFREPEAARAYEDGLNAYEQLEYSTALDAFSRSVRLEDQHVLSHAWLSRVALILSRKNEAIAAARRARQLVEGDGSVPEDVFIDAVLAESQGDLTAAEVAYQRLVTIEPDDPRARTELADFLKRRQDRNEAAIEAYHEVLRRDPTYIKPHVDLCQLYTRGDDYPLAEREAHTARDRFRQISGRGGEAQALLCLAEEQRKQAGPHLVEARRNVEDARLLIAALGQPYNLARALFYKGLVEYTDGRLAEATAIFRDAATELGRVGNTGLEGVALMNLGSISYQLGQPTPGLDFYRRSREVFLKIGDERRAAEADVLAAGAQGDYGVDSAGAVRTLVNARANLERLGYPEFQLYAMQSEADSYRYAGRLSRARTLLRSAFEIARSRGLADNVSGVSVSLGLADLEANEYHEARVSLERAAAGGTSELEARIGLGTVLTRLGEFERAREVLQQALADVETRELVRLLPLAHHARGVLAIEMKDLPLARAEFDAAISSWTDPLPNAAVVEARCERGFQDAVAGRRGVARAGLDAGVAQ
ncbi:MAG: protein kinase, partial [Acidobacteriota bacterium]